MASRPAVAAGLGRGRSRRAERRGRCDPQRMTSGGLSNWRPSGVDLRPPAQVSHAERVPAGPPPARPIAGISSGGWFTARAGGRSRPEAPRPLRSRREGSHRLSRAKLTVFGRQLLVDRVETDGWTVARGRGDGRGEPPDRDQVGPPLSRQRDRRSRGPALDRRLARSISAVVACQWRISEPSDAAWRQRSANHPLTTLGCSSCPSVDRESRAWRA